MAAGQGWAEQNRTGRKRDTAESHLLLSYHLSDAYLSALFRLIDELPVYG